MTGPEGMHVVNTTRPCLLHSALATHSGADSRATCWEERWEEYVSSFRFHALARTGLNRTSSTRALLERIITDYYDANGLLGPVVPLDPGLREAAMLALIRRSDRVFAFLMFEFNEEEDGWVFEEEFVLRIARLLREQQRDTDDFVRFIADEYFEIYALSSDDVEFDEARFRAMFAPILGGITASSTDAWSLDLLDAIDAAVEDAATRFAEERAADGWMLDD